MQQMKKHIMQLLILAAIFTVSCSGTETKPEVMTTGSENTEPINTKAVELLPEVDYGQKELTVLANITLSTSGWQEAYFVESENGESLNDAVYAANISVEEYFNINLNYVFRNDGGLEDRNAIKAEMTQKMMAGDTEYDAITSSSEMLFYLVPEQLLADLKSINTIELTGDHWLKYVNDGLEIDDRLLMASGYWGLNAVRRAECILINRKVASNYDISGVEQTVLDGKWTVDAMMSYAGTVATDLNGDGEMVSQDDINGLGATWDHLGFWPNAFDYQFVSLDDNGRLDININEKIFNITDILQSVQQDIAYCEKPDLADFGTDKMLFYQGYLNSVEKEHVRNMEDYTVLPMPKYDENQQDYITPMVPDAVAIPFVCEDEEMSGQILDALQLVYDKEIRTLFYDTLLKDKYSRDEVTADLIDLVFSHPVCDYAYLSADVVGWDFFYGPVSNKNFASFMEKNDNKWMKTFDKISDSIIDREY